MGDCTGDLLLCARAIQTRFAQVLSCSDTGGDALGIGAMIERIALPGGKWIRSRFCAATYLGLAEQADPQCERLVELGVAIELFNTFALVHDDIIDQSGLRRGRPTVHAAAESLHRGSGFRGDPALFGQSVGLLAGDHLLSLAWASLGALTAGSPDLLTMWLAMSADVVNGEVLELDAAAREDCDVERALRIVDLKTGLYTVAYPMQFGAVLAGHAWDSPLCRSLRTIGIDIGRAFQLQDDLLNVYGDESVTGKPAGLDVLSGKPTVFRARCVAALAASGALAETALKDFTSSPERAAEIGAQTGVAAELGRDIDRYLDSAEAGLRTLPLSTPIQHHVCRLIENLRIRRG